MPVTQVPSHENQFRRLSACVLIPTYNNAQTLAEVIASVAAFTQQIIVVNDGSTDNTTDILSQFPFLEVLSYTPNRGKGNALKRGFRFALELGYRYAVTIDSDGQHYAHDLPAFLHKIEEVPGSLIIGARNMDQAHIPGKSSFGNRFSNFWFWVETGIRLPDTQSGYRLYPLEPMRSMKFFTRKYEFEIETPVRIAWKGVAVISVPVSVYYPPAEERITHFRPFKDFTRISILNTFLTFIALLWIHPRNFLLKITSRNGWKDIWQQVVVRREETNLRKAWSIGFGVFMGIFPVWGFQLAIGIPLSVYFKMNKALFLLAANISIFPFTPVFWALSLVTGKIILGFEDWSFRWKDMSLSQFTEAGLAFFLGGAVLATVLGLLAFGLSFLLLKVFRKEINIGDQAK
jgi:glycosyltransferase involved in cell wall biosynthesis